MIQLEERFYSTYEELKPVSASMTICIKALFLQYLWGIETVSFPLSSTTLALFLQYLWGIETHFATPFLDTSLHRFYSTYEELKHDFSYWCLFVEKGFYSTYEELKLLLFYIINSHIIMFLQYLWGIETCYFHENTAKSNTRFYSTYEELKLQKTGKLNKKKT